MSTNYKVQKTIKQVREQSRKLKTQQLQEERRGQSRNNSFSNISRVHIRIEFERAKKQEGIKQNSKTIKMEGNIQHLFRGSPPLLRRLHTHTESYSYCPSPNIFYTLHHVSNEIGGRKQMKRELKTIAVVDSS